MEYGRLKLDVDGTEDVGYDEDDQAARKKLRILIARDLFSGLMLQLVLRNKGVTEYVTLWLVSLLRRLAYR